MVGSILLHEDKQRALESIQSALQKLPRVLAEITGLPQALIDSFHTSPTRYGTKLNMRGVKAPLALFSLHYTTNLDIKTPLHAYSSEGLSPAPVR